MTLSRVFSKCVISAFLRIVGVEMGDSKKGILVKDDRFYRVVYERDSLGFGDSYVEGFWECDHIDEVVCTILSSIIDRKILMKSENRRIRQRNRSNYNPQDRHGSRKVIEEHYDDDPNFFLSFLGSYNQYTNNFFLTPDDDLNQAEINKLNESKWKLDIKPGDNILDIGGGWGGWLDFLTSRVEGVEGTLVTLSASQAAYARDTLKGRPVEIVLCDYRDIPNKLDEGSYDKVSVFGFMEHVGVKNYDEMMNVINYALKPGGLFLLHTIFSPESVGSCNSWLTQRIFPNGFLPSREMIREATGKRFTGVMRDRKTGKLERSDEYHDLTEHYDKTCMAWWDKFSQSVKNGAIRVDEKTFRTMKFYLMSCAGGFRAKRMRHGQFLYVKQP